MTTYTVDEKRATFEPFAYAQELKDRAEAAEARAAEEKNLHNTIVKNAWARIEQLESENGRLTLERDNALAERDRANAGFVNMKRAYEQAIARLAKLGDKVTA